MKINLTEARVQVSAPAFGYCSLHALQYVYPYLPVKGSTVASHLTDAAKPDQTNVNETFIQLKYDKNTHKNNNLYKFNANETKNS